MKTKLTTIILFLALSINPALALTTFGQPDCGQWLTNKKMTDKTWILGYISGINYQYGLMNELKNPLNNINSSEQIFVWIDNYCEKVPFGNVGDGTWWLFEELKKNTTKWQK